MTEKNNGDSSKEGKNSVFADVVSFFTSARTTIFLLFILAAGSVLGTVIPQTTEITPVISFPQRLAAILDLNNVYKSWWFTTLLVLLSLNLLGCLLERLPSIPGEWRGKSSKPTFSLNLTDAKTPSEIKKTVVSALSGILGSPEPANEKDTEITWVKGRIHLLGFPFIHIAIIVILAGGLVGLFYGYRGHILIKEGESADEFSLQSGQSANLPFSIFVESFTLTRYPTGEPKEFRSDVKLRENNKEVLKGSILVNHPMTYNGISLFQSDYRVAGVKEVKFGLIDAEGKASDFSMDPYSVEKLPGTDYQVRLLSLNPGGNKLGAGVKLTILREGEEPRHLEVYGKEPVKIGDLKIRFVDYVPLYATGLQIGYDPGTKIVWAGCGLLIIGFFLTLFTNHRTLTVRIGTEKKQTRIQVSGRSKRMRREFRESVERITRDALKASDSSAMNK